MDRRGFFKTAIGKAGKTVVEHVDRKVARHAAHWVRPPFALPELEFLLHCSRCGDCIAACPHHIIFPLPASRGAKFAGTPALDLLNRGCHLCTDWPCVTACNTSALQLPDTAPDETPSSPKLARASIDETRCLPYQGPECGACAGSCPIPGALNWDRQKPRVDPDACVGCGLCRVACIAEPKAVRIASLYKEVE